MRSAARLTSVIEILEKVETVKKQLVFDNQIDGKVESVKTKTEV